MNQLKRYLKLYTDLKQPYFYGLIFVISLLIGTFLHMDAMIYPIMISAGCCIMSIVYAFIVDSKEKLKAGWDSTVFILMLVGAIVMALLTKFI